MGQVGRQCRFWFRGAAYWLCHGVSVSSLQQTPQAARETVGLFWRPLELREETSSAFAFCLQLQPGDPPAASPWQLPPRRGMRASLASRSLLLHASRMVRFQSLGLALQALRSPERNNSASSSLKPWAALHAGGVPSRPSDFSARASLEPAALQNQIGQSIPGSWPQQELGFRLSLKAQVATLSRRSEGDRARSRALLDKMQLPLPRQSRACVLAIRAIRRYKIPGGHQSLQV